MGVFACHLLGLVFILGLSFGDGSAARLGVVADEDSLTLGLIAALFQGLYIMVASWLLFGLNWGEPLGASALLIVSAAAGKAVVVAAEADGNPTAGSPPLF